jgi:hypothetical protein
VFCGEHEYLDKWKWKRKGGSYGPKPGSDGTSHMDIKGVSRGPSSRHHGRRGNVLGSVSDVLINRIDDSADGTRWRGLREGRCRSGRCSEKRLSLHSAASTGKEFDGLEGEAMYMTLCI